MKKTTLTLCLLTFYFSMLAQPWKDQYVNLSKDPVEGFHTAQKKPGYKWGFVNAATGDSLTAFKYDKIGNFSGGLAMVSANKKFGYIDKTGKEVIPLMYDDARSFREEVAAVNIGAKVRDNLAGGNWGFIDKTGKTVVPITYHSVDFFYNELIGVRTYKGWGFVDKKGKMVIPDIYSEVHSFSEGFASVRRELKPEEEDTVAKKKEGYNKHKWTLINKTGKEIIPPTYDWAKEMKNGLMSVTMNRGSYDRRSGFINTKGKLVIDLIYHDAFSFNEGLAPVSSPETKLWGYIDPKGKLVFPLKYTYAYAFINGEAKVQIDKARFLLTKDGKETPAIW